MNNDTVVQILKDFRCYEFSSFNCGATKDEMLPAIISERMKSPGRWDQDRYPRMVGTIKGAVDYCLDDDQRTVITRKYLDRNKLNLNEIAHVLHKHRTTIKRYHTEALNILCKAFSHLEPRDYEITNYDHFFDKDWQYIPQESA